MPDQTMSYFAVKQRSKSRARVYGKKILAGELTLESAHKMLINPDANHLDLFDIAGLAQAIACFQCE